MGILLSRPMNNAQPPFDEDDNEKIAFIALAHQSYCSLLQYPFIYNFNLNCRNVLFN